MRSDALVEHVGHNLSALGNEESRRIAVFFHSQLANEFLLVVGNHGAKVLIISIVCVLKLLIYGRVR